MCEGSTGGDRDGIRHFLGYGLSATASPRGAAFTNGVSVGATCLATYVQGYGQSPGGNYVIEFIFLCMTLAFVATEMARCLRQGSSIILQGTVGHTGFRHHTGYQIAGFRPSFCRVPSVIPGFDHHFAGFRHTGFRPSFCRVPSVIPGFVIPGFVVPGFVIPGSVIPGFVHHFAGFRRPYRVSLRASITASRKATAIPQGHCKLDLKVHTLKSPST